MTPENSGENLESTQPDKYTVEYISADDILRITVHVGGVQFDRVYNKSRVDEEEDEDGRLALEFRSREQYMMLKDEVNDDYLMTFSLSPTVQFSAYDFEVESTPRPGEIRIDIPMPNGIRKQPRPTYEDKFSNVPVKPEDIPALELPTDLTIDIDADIINGKGWSEYIELVNPTHFEKKVASCPLWLKRPVSDT
ncbi:hypothetical protein [Haloplanus salilacus]|uniref:hypothetical protein n=1 Tax=Haloplanus salilacus TaxID=2949994 RepID=UPI0030D45E42